MSGDPGVLVVGAGPTGLTLALQAAAHGATVRVVERRGEPFRPSRALMVHARTLEVLRPLGAAGGVVERGDTSPRAVLRLGRRSVPVALGEVDLPDTAFSHLTIVAQADVESVLEGALTACGVRVERGTELTAVREGGDGVAAELRSAAGVERRVFRAVAGCDGAESSVRAAAGIGWPGGVYDREIVLADLDLDGDLEPGVAHVVAGARGLLFLFALGEQAPWRLLATRPVSDRAQRPGRPGPAVPAGQLQALLDEAGLPAAVTDVAWSSTVVLQHRVAARFRSGGLFLAGDAAHATSPAGGQGMNTGIQDAANLGWKLAFAPAATAAETLLNSYDDERRPADARVVGLTHLLFWAESATGPVTGLLRGRVASWGAPLARHVLGYRRLVAEGVRLLARLDVDYRDGPLSAEGLPRRSGGPRAGDRLPDAEVDADGRWTRLHELTARPGVHVLLDRDAIDPGVSGPSVHVHRLTGAAGAGAVVVRPDGHIGYRSADAGDPGLRSWLRRVGAVATDERLALAASRP